jgi:hypothetical protein
MNRPLKTGMIAGIVGVIAVGLIEVVLAKSENDFFQFCTTKAYGWPAPWRIDYCECEGAKTTYPTTSKIVNLSAIAGGGIGGFALCGGIALLRRRADYPKQNKSCEATGDNVSS